MSLPLTAICVDTKENLPIFISGGVIYRGSTVVAQLDVEITKGAIVSYASFFAPYLVICAGHTICVFLCDNSVSLFCVMQCHTMVLSMYPIGDTWLLSFISGDWGCLKLSTKTLSHYKGSSGVFFSSHFVGCISTDTVLLALGSAAPRIELCLINILKLTYNRVATISTPSFPVFCIRSNPLEIQCSIAEQHFLLLVLSYKHAHIFPVTIPLKTASDGVLSLDGWPIMDSATRLYSACITDDKIFLGDDVGTIYAYKYSLSNSNFFTATLCYCTRLHHGIIKAMVFLNSSLYTCGEDGVLMHFPTKEFSMQLTKESLLTEHTYPQNYESGCLYSTMICLDKDLYCTIIYRRKEILLYDSVSFLRVPLFGIRPNCFDEIAVEDRGILIVVGYTISAIYCFYISISPLTITKTLVINFERELRSLNATYANLPTSLSVSSCHILAADSTTITLFTYIYSCGGAVIKFGLNDHNLLSIQTFNLISPDASPILMNAQTGIFSSICLDKEVFYSRGPLISSAIDLSYPDGLHIIFVYTRAGYLQVFRYVHEKLHLLFPIIELCDYDNNRGTLYAKRCSGLQENANDCNHSFYILLLAHSGKVHLIQLCLKGNDLFICNQISTRSILLSNTYLLNWTNQIILASNNKTSWLITSLCPSSLTFIQDTIYTSINAIGKRSDSIPFVSDISTMLYNAHANSYNFLEYTSEALRISFIDCPALSAKILKSGWASGYEINAHAILNNKIICGAETGEVTLHTSNLEFIKTIYFCDASVRSIATTKISSTLDLILVGSSSSQLICLFWNSIDVSVLKMSKFPIKYIQPSVDELDIRYTAILPFPEISTGLSIMIFLAGISIGELWLMCLVYESNCIYLIERQPINGVPMRIRTICIDKEIYIVVASTQGLLVISFNSSKLIRLANMASSFMHMNISYTRHVLSQKPLSNACGIGKIMNIEWMDNILQHGSLVDCLVYNNFVITFSDIGYGCLYGFERAKSGIQISTESIWQHGCTNGIICSTEILRLNNCILFMYVGWDRIPQIRKLELENMNVTVFKGYALNAVPLYNIHQLLCFPIDSQKSTVIFCGSGLFATSVINPTILLGG